MQSPVATKQESVDYFYSSCDVLGTAVNSAPAPNVNVFPLTFYSHAGAGAVIPLSSSAARSCTDLRRTDEMLSAQSFRWIQSIRMSIFDE